MNDLDHELSHLFDAARSATEPTRADRKRIRAALAAKLASGVLLTSASAHAAAGSAGATVGGAVSKGLKLVLLTQVGPGLIAGTLLGGGASLVALVATDPTPAPSDIHVSPAQVSAQSAHSTARPAPVTTVSSGGPSADTPAPAPSPRSSLRPVAEPLPSAADRPSSALPAIAAFPEPKPQPQPERSELSNELATVSRMQSAWQRGDWAGVRSAIQSHEQQFPRGTLTEEREAVKVMLACRSDPARALELGATFSAKHPNSTHAVRVSAVCRGGR
jgi:hypothetical protein